MLELLLKLVDRLIDMAKHRQEVNREIIVDFAAPAMADFELVHKDYLESFRRYHEMLEDAAVPLTTDHPVFAAILKDNLFSEGLRSRITELARLGNDPVLGRFISRVLAYLHGATRPSAFYVERASTQRLRRDYRATLSAIVASDAPEPEKRRLALDALDESVRSLQERYSQVFGEYFELRKTLLKPL